MQDKQQPHFPSEGANELDNRQANEPHVSRQKTHKLQHALATTGKHTEGKRASQAHKHDVSAQSAVHDSRESSYTNTLEQMRKDLPRSTRAFSKFIHNRFVEQASDIVANTVARPNAILAGGIAAFLTVLVLYSYARFAGFSLQGSETILAFSIGWAIGTIYDLISTALSRKNQE